MFVGKYLQLGRFCKVVDIECAGAAIGGLGRHTNVTPDGMPIFNGRMEMLFTLGLNNPKLVD